MPDSTLYPKKPFTTGQPLRNVFVWITVLPSPGAKTSLSTHLSKLARHAPAARHLAHLGLHRRAEPSDGPVRLVALRALRALQRAGLAGRLERSCVSRMEEGRVKDVGHQCLVLHLGVIERNGQNGRVLHVLLVGSVAVELCGGVVIYQDESGGYRWVPDEFTVCFRE